MAEKFFGGGVPGGPGGGDGTGGPPPIGGEAVGVGGGDPPFLVGGDGDYQIIDGDGSLMGRAGATWDITIDDAGNITITTDDFSFSGEAVVYAATRSLYDFLESEGIDFVRDDDGGGSEPTGPDDDDGDIVDPENPFGPPLPDTGENVLELGGELLPEIEPDEQYMTTGVWDDIGTLARAIIGPAKEYQKEGEEALGRLFQKVPYLGPGWDRIREELHRILDPVKRDLDEEIERNRERIPDIVEPALEDATTFITDLVTLDAVPVPVPWFRPLPPLPGWLIVIGILVQILWWLFREPQAPSYVPVPQQPKPKDPDDQEETEPDEQGRDYRRPSQPIILPVPVPQDQPRSREPDVTIGNGCVFYRIRPRNWVRVCRRRGQWEVVMSAQGIRVEAEFD